MNVGSPRSTDNLNGLVLINTHFTACSSAVLWVITVQVYTGQSSCMDILYGLMSGLAGKVVHLFFVNIQLSDIHNTCSFYER